MRVLTIVSVVCALLSAFALYATNYDARTIQVSVQTLEHNIEKTRLDIAVLKADRAHLARPERLATFARALGLAPAKGSQFAVLSGGRGDMRLRRSRLPVAGE